MMQKLGKNHRFVVEPQRGSSLIYMTISMFVIAAFMSLAIDLARARLVQAELQAIADAAARAAASDLSNRTDAKQAALAAVNKNNGGDTAFTIDLDQDIQFGKWNKNNRTFATTTSGGDAVKITMQRTTARGNAVPLLLAPLIGMDTCNVTASAIARKRSTGFTLVGIDSVLIKNAVDSFDFSDGPYSTTKESTAIVASNGNITFQTGQAKLLGDAYPGVNGTVSSSSLVSGTIENLTEPLNFPMPTLGTYNNSAIGIAPNGDLDLNGGHSMDLPAGNYYVNDIDTMGNTTLRVLGDVTLYVSGNVKVRGTFTVANDNAANLKIRMITAGTTFSMSGNAVYRADIYAPGSAVSFAGSSEFYGAAIGKTLTLDANNGTHHDHNIEPFDTKEPKIALVE